MLSPSFIQDERKKKKNSDAGNFAFEKVTSRWWMGGWLHNKTKTIFYEDRWEGEREREEKPRRVVLLGHLILLRL